MHGEWKDRFVRPSLYTRVMLQPAVFGLVALGVAAVALSSWQHRR